MCAYLCFEVEGDCIAANKSKIFLAFCWFFLFFRLDRPRPILYRLIGLILRLSTGLILRISMSENVFVCVFMF